MKKPLGAIFAILICTGCSQNSKLMEVDVFRHRDTELLGNDAAMVRGDQQYVMFQKLSNQERADTLGQYYTIKRREAEKPAVVEFNYLQSRTGSEVLTKKIPLAIGDQRAFFSVIGKNFIENGRVLAWKVDLIEDNKLVATEQSYLWE